MVACAAAALLLTALFTIRIAPLFDPDEGYYPATAAEGLDRGSLWDPHFNGEPRWDKPILTYALIEGSFALFGESTPASRLPSVLEGVLLILIAGAVVKQVAGARAACLTGLVLCSTAGIQIFARVAHPEIGLVTMITTAELLAVLGLLSERRSEQLRLAALTGVALGLGALFKGPVAIALPLLAVGGACLVMFGVRWPSARFTRAVLIAGAVAGLVALPWYAAMTWRHGDAFLQEAVWQQNVGRFMGDARVHGARLWFFIVPAIVAMFPWTAFIPAAFSRVSRTSRRPVDVLRLVMASAAVTSFTFYSVSGSQLSHYALAFVPPLAILVALRLDEVRTVREMSLSVRATAIVIGASAVILAIAPLLIDRVVKARDILGGLPRESNHITLFAIALWPAALFLAATAVALAVLPARPWRTLGVAGVLLPTLLIVSSQPLLARAYPQDRFAALLRQSDLPIWVIGPRMPSLTFYAGRRVSRLSEGDALHAPLPPHDAWIVADSGWLMRRAQSPDDASRMQIIDSYGSMTLLRWHGAVNPSSPSQAPVAKLRVIPHSPVADIDYADSRRARSD